MRILRGRIVRVKFVPRRRRGGFTLLEVMIALAVFAVMSIALTKSATATIAQTRIIEEKTLAYWIAHSHLNKMKLAERTTDSFPAISRRHEETTMMDQKWSLVIDVESTDNSDIRRVNISVSQADDDERVLGHLTGFIGKY